MISDLEIQKNVMDEIRWEPSLNPAEIGVAVKHGIVTLTGQVDSFFKKQIAENSAKRVKGVKAIAEDIQIGVSPLQKRTDVDIAAAIVNALQWHTVLQEEKITIKVEDGVVYLEGEVEWAYQKKNAKTAIENLVGVSAIVNLIKVKPKLVAANIEQKIFDAFQRNASIDAKKIHLTIEGNKVIMTGTVQSFTEKEDAENAAWAAPGVLFVENKLMIETPEYIFYE
jgi:osmotically-inducible protein OsmY